VKIETLESFLTEIVVPMFPGASIKKSNFVPFNRTTEIVVYDHAPTRLRVRQNASTKEFFTITRLQAWVNTEKHLVKKLISVFDQTISTAAPLLNQLEDYLSLASQAAENAVAVALNRNGEILLFAQGELKFAKRRGRWLHFTHKPVVTSMSWGGASPLDIRESIYESCLDASFARTGGCIGIVRKHQLSTFYSEVPCLRRRPFRHSNKI